MCSNRVFRQGSRNTCVIYARSIQDRMTYSSKLYSGKQVGFYKGQYSLHSKLFRGATGEERAGISAFCPSEKLVESKIGRRGVGEGKEEIDCRQTPSFPSPSPRLPILLSTHFRLGKRRIPVLCPLRQGSAIVNDSVWKKLSKEDGR